VSDSRETARVHWLDIASARIQPAKSFYRGGWGDRAAFDLFCEEVRLRREPTAVTPTLKRRRLPVLGARAYDGEFASPASFLPREVARARVCVYLPRGRVCGVCLHLGGLGEQTFARREWLARELVKSGIGSVLLETPYHGTRRPTIQRGGGGITSIADQMRLSTAVVAESAALLGWLRAVGYRAAVSGFSMGGSLAAFTAVRVPWPIDLVAAGLPMSGSHVAAQGLLRRLVCWEALGGAHDGVTALTRAYDSVALHHFGPPVDASRAHLIGFCRDGIVPASSTRAIHAHWPGSSLSWVDTGHVGGFLRSHHALAQGIRRAFAVADREPVVTQRR
jgi:hypothetical protein